MERAAIEARIRVVSSMLAKATKIEDLKFFNRLIERLVMMQSDEEKMKSDKEVEEMFKEGGTKV